MKTRRLLQLIFQALLLSATVSAAIAQEDKPTTQKRKFHHDGVIKSAYDKARDQTVIALQRYRVYPEALPRYGYTSVTITVSFAFPGRVPISLPKVVGLVMSTETTGDWRFREEPELTALVDDEPVTFGKMRVSRQGGIDRSSSVGGSSAANLYREELVARITYEGFLRISNARKVEMRAGDAKFKLERNLLEALRDLASRAVPQL